MSAMEVSSWSSSSSSATIGIGGGDDDKYAISKLDSTQATGQAQAIETSHILSPVKENKSEDGTEILQPIRLIRVVKDQNQIVNIRCLRSTEIKTPALHAMLSSLAITRRTPFMMSSV